MACCSPYNDVFIAGECSSADGLAAVLASCAPPLPYQGLEDGIGHKRPLYSIFDASEETVDEDMSDDVAAHQVEKKRRLSVEQVKSLEKNFEMENKLEPERKIQLARELGLQPRQVAVWFQNRRARWKTKQLEKDYDLLKSEYDDLKSGYLDLVKDKELLQNEVARLRERLAESGSCDNLAAASSHKVKIEERSSSAANLHIGDGDLPPAEANSCLDFGSKVKEASFSSDSDASEILEAESSQDRSVAAPAHDQMNNVNYKHHHHQHQHQQHQQHQQQQQQQVLGFLLHEDLSFCKGSGGGLNSAVSFNYRPGLLMKVEDDDQELEDQGGGGQASFTWPWDWA